MYFKLGGRWKYSPVTSPLVFHPKNEAKKRSRKVKHKSEAEKGKSKRKKQSKTTKRKKSGQGSLQQHETGRNSLRLKLSVKS